MRACPAKGTPVGPHSVHVCAKQASVAGEVPSKGGPFAHNQHPSLPFIRVPFALQLSPRMNRVLILVALLAIGVECAKHRAAGNKQSKHQQPPPAEAEPNRQKSAQKANVELPSQTPGAAKDLFLHALRKLLAYEDKELEHSWSEEGIEKLLPKISEGKNGEGQDYFGQLKSALRNVAGVARRKRGGMQTVVKEWDPRVTYSSWLAARGEQKLADRARENAKLAELEEEIDRPDDYEEDREGLGSMEATSAELRAHYAAMLPDGSEDVEAYLEKQKQLANEYKRASAHQLGTFNPFGHLCIVRNKKTNEVHEDRCNTLVDLVNEASTDEGKSAVLERYIKLMYDFFVLEAKRLDKEEQDLPGMGSVFDEVRGKKSKYQSHPLKARQQRELANQEERAKDKQLRDQMHAKQTEEPEGGSEEDDLPALVKNTNHSIDWLGTNPNRKGGARTGTTNQQKNARGRQQTRKGRD